MGLLPRKLTSTVWLFINHLKVCILWINIPFKVTSFQEKRTSYKNETQGHSCYASKKWQISSIWPKILSFHRMLDLVYLVGQVTSNIILNLWVRLGPILAMCCPHIVYALFLRTTLWQLELLSPYNLAYFLLALSHTPLFCSIVIWKVSIPLLLASSFLFKQGLF